MKSWLTRCESVCCPDSDLLGADKVKLRNERLNVQVILTPFFFLIVIIIFFFTLLKTCFPSLSNCAGNAERGSVL